MSLLIKVWKTEDGRFKARRVDGKPLTTEDREEARRMVAGETRHAAAQGETSAIPSRPTAQQILDIDASKISVVLIDSQLGPLWFAFGDDCKCGDDIPVFFASELPVLRKMTPEELRQRYQQKKALGGGWIRDRIEH